MAANLLPLIFFLFLFLPYSLDLIPCTSTAYAAATITVAWDKNAETDVIGYNFHYGTVSKNYQYTVDVKNNTSCSISGLAEGTTYYFAVTAYNDKDLESSYSEELAYTIPDSPPPPPPPPVYTEPVQPVGSWLSGLNHAVEPGVKRVLVFTAHVEDNDGVPNLAGVTYGGQAMTKIIEQSVGSSTRAYVVAYILEEDDIAAASNGEFVPAWTETPDKVAYSSMFFINVDQATPIGRSDSNSTTSLSTLATNSLATAHGDLVFVAGTCGNSGNYSVNNDFIEEIELRMSSSDAVAGYKQATGTNEIPSITHSKLNRQVVVGFVVQNYSE